MRNICVTSKYILSCGWSIFSTVHVNAEISQQSSDELLFIARYISLFRDNMFQVYENNNIEEAVKVGIPRLESYVLALNIKKVKNHQKIIYRYLN